MMARLALLLATPLVLATPALATAAASIDLHADAFHAPSGPRFRLGEAVRAFDAPTPPIRRMEIARPAGTTVRPPPPGGTLGALVFFVGPRTCPTCSDRRTLALRRVRALGGGTYLLGAGSGARVVLSTGRRFLTVTTPKGARDVTLTLRSRGARLLRLPRCRPLTFQARFVPAARGRDTITAARLRRAGLC